MARALVADSSTPSRRAAQFLLESLGFEVAEACAVEEVIRTAETLAPDVILLDSKLARTALIEALKASGAYLLFVTENGGQAMIRAAMEAGSDDYLVLPFDRELLSFKLAQARARGRLQESASRMKLVQDNAGEGVRRLNAAS